MPSKISNFHGFQIPAAVQWCILHRGTVASLINGTAVPYAKAIVVTPQRLGGIAKFTAKSQSLYLKDGKLVDGRQRPSELTNNMAIRNNIFCMIGTKFDLTITRRIVSKLLGLKNNSLVSADNLDDPKVKPAVGVMCNISLECQKGNNDIASSFHVWHMWSLGDRSSYPSERFLITSDNTYYLHKPANKPMEHNDIELGKIRKTKIRPQTHLTNEYDKVISELLGQEMRSQC